MGLPQGAQDEVEDAADEEGKGDDGGDHERRRATALFLDQDHRAKLANQDGI